MRANPLYKKLLPEFIELSKEHKSQRKAARILFEKYNPGVTYSTLRTKLNQYALKHQDSTSETVEYNNGEDALGTDAFKSYCEAEGLDISKVKSAKYVNHDGQQKFNVVLDYDKEDVKEIDFDSIISKHIKPVNYEPKKINTNYLFDRLVYTDSHIGMDVNPNGHSLYDGKWNEEEVNNKMLLIVDHIIDNKKSNTLVIDDLGDFADGWSAETARGGHHLPQNMDNEKVFDVGLAFKVGMIDRLAKRYTKIIVHNICNSNHSGNGFDYVINSAFKSIVEVKYDNIEVYNYRKFIEHYSIKNYYFVISHGKDAKNLKFGFKPILDDKQVNKIKHYIEKYNIPRGVKIEFSKGDSHQYLFDNSTSDMFSYYNYPALSPSSDWVKTNFQYGISGCIFFNYTKDRKEIKELIF